MYNTLNNLHYDYATGVYYSSKCKQLFLTRRAQLDKNVWRQTSAENLKSTVFSGVHKIVFQSNNDVCTAV